MLEELLSCWGIFIYDRLHYGNESQENILYFPKAF